MFGKMMYYDKKTVDEYKSLITGQRKLEIEEYEVSNDKGAGVDLKLFSADTNSSKKYVAKVVESLLYDCNEFEELLSERDDYYDFTRTDGLDLSTIQRGSIVKVDAFLEIPEQFDIMQVLDSFKPMFIDSIEEGDIEKTGKEVLKAYLRSAKATKIPVIVEAEENLLCSKLHYEYLISEYEEFEEIDEEISILARISSGIVNCNKPFYDPLKDFMTLNRIMRRSMKERGEELTAITVEKDYRVIDILAIYR